MEAKMSHNAARRSTLLEIVVAAQEAQKLLQEIQRKCSEENLLEAVERDELELRNQELAWRANSLEKRANSAEKRTSEANSSKNSENGIRETILREQSVESLQELLHDDVDDMTDVSELDESVFSDDEGSEKSYQPLQVSFEVVFPVQAPANEEQGIRLEASEEILVKSEECELEQAPVVLLEPAKHELLVFLEPPERVELDSGSDSRPRDLTLPALTSETVQNAEENSNLEKSDDFDNSEEVFVRADTMCEDKVLKPQGEIQVEAIAECLVSNLEETLPMDIEEPFPDYSEEDLLTEDDILPSSTNTNLAASTKIDELFRKLDEVPARDSDTKTTATPVKKTNTTATPVKNTSPTATPASDYPAEIDHDSDEEFEIDPNDFVPNDPSEYPASIEVLYTNNDHLGKVSCLRKPGEKKKKKKKQKVRILGQPDEPDAAPVEEVIEHQETTVVHAEPEPEPEPEPVKPPTPEPVTQIQNGDAAKPEVKKEPPPAPPREELNSLKLSAKEYREMMAKKKDKDARNKAIGFKAKKDAFDNL